MNERITRRTVKQKLFLLFILCFSITCFSCAAGGNGDEKTHVNKNEAFKILAEAIEKGRENNTGTVNINLNEYPDSIQEGDLALINYALYSENGELLCSNIEDLQNSMNNETNRCYNGIVYPEPLEVISGEPDFIPLLHTEILGMKAGESKRINLKPEEAFGQKQNDKIKVLSSIREIPREVEIPADQLSEAQVAKLEKGDRINLNPYFEHVIMDVSNKKILLKADLEDHFNVEADFGNVGVYPEKDIIKTILFPETGSNFKMGKENCFIASKNDSSFTVDCNHPLSGINLSLYINPLKIEKKSSLSNWNVTWIDDYYEGLEAAAKNNMPAVVIVYADWCGWCEKMFNETLRDPRVLMFRNDFVWIKANSKSYPELRKLYSRDSYPIIALVGCDGEEIKNMTGFKYAPVFREELRKVLHDDRKIKG